ncbi:MAG: PorV/PorQ family protein [Elusimicrobiota bacterium]
MKKTLAFLAIWILAPPAAWGGGTEGATPFNFLFLDANARPAALGGAYAAVATDANALQYNPAGLGGVSSNHVTFQHTEHFQGVSQEYAALALKQGFGFMFNTVSFGKIQRTTVSDPRGTGLGTFGIRDLAASVGYGRSYKDGLLSLGVAGKYISEEIDNFRAQAGAVDLGAILDLKSHGLPMALGLAVQNVGTKAKFQSSREDLPVNVKTGIGWRFLESGLLIFDANIPREGGATMHIGGEYVALKTLALRVGYNGRNDAGSGVTFGGGLQHNRFSVDYAFVPFGDLGNSHRLSLSYRW